MNAGEGIHTALLRVELREWRPHLASGYISPAYEPHIVIEEQIALGLSLRNDERGVMLRCVIDGLKVEIAKFEGIF